MSTYFKKLSRMIALLLVIAISLSGNVNPALGSPVVHAEGEWQTYIDPEYGFQVGYPQDWTGAVAFQNDPQVEDVVIKRFTIQNTESAFINIDIWNNATGLNIPEWIDLHLKSTLDGTATIPSTSNVTVGGTEGFLIVQPADLGQQVPGRNITILSHNGFIYQIEYIAQDGGAAQDIYTAVLETFEFVTESTQPDHEREAPIVGIQAGDSTQPAKDYREIQSATSTSFSKSSPANESTGTSTTVTLKWNAPSSSPVKYRYAIGTEKTSNDWTSVYGATQVTVKNLVPNKTYYWQVQAVFCDTCVPKDIVSANNGTWWSFTVQQTYPTVTSIVRSSPSDATTNAASVSFAVTFSAAVTGVDTTDFRLTTTGSITGASVTGVSGSGSSYIVAVNTGSGDGTIRLDVIDNDTIKNSTQGALGGTGVGNGNFIKGQIYTIDKTPSVLSSILQNPNPTNAVSVNFTVTFSIAVVGVDATDFALTTTGITGASIVSVSGSGTTYIVNVNTGSGLGTIRLDVVDDDSIKDNLLNPLGGAGTGNGKFQSGSFYTLIAPAKPSFLSHLPITNNSTPTFSWGAVANADHYEIQFATNVSFTQGVNSHFVNNTTFTFSSSLSSGKYYWRVRVYDVRNSPSGWSGIRDFIIDTLGPAVPVLQSPANGASVRSVPTFRWNTVSDAANYEFEIDDDSSFSDPLLSVSQRVPYRRPSGKLQGTYYWRVRAQDAAGNWSEWSTPFTINVLPPRRPTR